MSLAPSGGEGDQCHRHRGTVSFVAWPFLAGCNADTLLSTCEWIQETYGISNPTLIANNPQIDGNCENIYVGEVLCVDTDDYVYPEVNQTIYQVSLAPEQGRCR